jgi:hypothetical protein
MSDFDDVLERLLTDPAFQSALREDPQAALAGYQLAPDEWQLLQVQLDADSGEDRTVETRVSKSGVFGLVGPVVSALGFVEPPAGHAGTAVVPPQPESATEPGNFGVAHVGARSGVGHVDPDDPTLAPSAVDYHTRVDADGDGRWDQFRAVERTDGGVDILVDRDGDGRVDFVGHDYDRDGLVDDADYDTDFDGVMDTRMSDVDGDGWMDTRAAYNPQYQSGVGVVPQGKSGAGVVPPDQG